MPKNKTDNFLKAIKRYAKEQKNAMKDEVGQLKIERLKEAEEKGKHDSDALIREKLHEKHNTKTALIAKQTQDGQRKLFIERSAMVDEVFDMAAKRLVEYTETDDYASKLEESAKAVAKVFDGKDCIIYVSERDLNASEAIKFLFDGKAEVKADKTIKIGGVRGYCAEMGIIADETLDSKLEAQREWFVENAGLTVL